MRADGPVVPAAEVLAERRAFALPGPACEYTAASGVHANELEIHQVQGFLTIPVNVTEFDKIVNNPRK